jgi:hypothetical protein
MRSIVPIACALCILGGCGGAQSRAWEEVSRSGPSAHTASSVEFSADLVSGGPVIELQAASRRGRARRVVALMERAPAARTERQQERARYAQLAPANGAAPTASDATGGSQLIYRAELSMAVHRVTEKQDAVEALARQLGGFLASRRTQEIVIRVPAPEFQNALGHIQELGDVVDRDIEVQDVSEEFIDLELRIRTLEAMQARVQQLLVQARDVQAALAVEESLERITVELERLRGRLRFLSDRVAYSTITVRFREHDSSGEPSFWLPFHWVHMLGADTLMELRR